MVKHALASAFAVAALGFAAPSSASVIDLSTLVGVWDVQDQFMDVGDFYANSYVASSAITLWFTDLFVQGDSYDVYVNGSLWYTTGFPPLDGTFITDPDTAFLSGKYASGIFALGAGDTIAFAAAALPAGFSDGTLAVTARPSDARVPEPATWALMIAGFGLIGGALRRRTLAAA
jgi:hypothetical protein